jgi:hypothetical protein
MFAQGTTVSSGGNTFAINYTGGTGNDVVLTATATPEPSTWNRRRARLRRARLPARLLKRASLML